MRWVSQLRIGRDDYEITRGEQRASARKRRSLHSRDERRINRAKLLHARTQPREQLSNATRILSARRKIKPRAERRAFAAQHDDINIVLLDKHSRFFAAQFKHFKRARIKRVSFVGVAQPDARDAAVTLELRKMLACTLAHCCSLAGNDSRERMEVRQFSIFAVYFDDALEPVVGGCVWTSEGSVTVCLPDSPTGSTTEGVQRN
jgi:hypothetical protein